jgi:hypothetical protein
MTDVRIEHRFDCSVNTFWERIFFDEEFNRGMYLKHLQFQDWKVIEQRETDAELIRLVSVTPKVGDLPGAIKSLIGDTLTYKEQGTYDKRNRHYRVTVVPSALADKISVTGDTWAEELTPTQCKRIFVASVTVKVFGVGGIIEKRIIADLQLSYNAGAVFTADYLKHVNLQP